MTTARNKKRTALSREEWLLSRIYGEDHPPGLVDALHATVEVLAEVLRGEFYDEEARCADADCKQCARTNDLRDDGWFNLDDEEEWTGDQNLVRMRPPR